MKCSKCKQEYYLLTDNKTGKKVQVLESSMHLNEISAIIGKIEIAYNPKKHIIHNHKKG